MAVSNDSKLKKFLSNFMLHLYESGKMDVLKSKYTIRTPDCRPILRDASPLSIHKLASGFVVILVGVAVALGLSLFEKLFPPQEKYNNVNQIGSFEAEVIKNVISTLKNISDKKHMDNAIKTAMDDLQILKTAISADKTYDKQNE